MSGYCTNKILSIFTFVSILQFPAKAKDFKTNLSLFVQHCVNQKEHFHPSCAEYSALMTVMFLNESLTKNKNRELELPVKGSKYRAKLIINSIIETKY